MIKTEVKDILHKETSEGIKRLLESIPDLYIENKLDDRLAEVGLNQKQFSQLTGLRHATISDFVNGKKIMLNKYQLLAILISLRITDIRDLIDVHFSEETKEQFKAEREKWIESGKNGLPEDLQEHYLKFLLK